MRKMILFITVMTASFCAISLSLALLAEDHRWRKVDRGLFVREFDSPLRPGTKESRITVVKIDPTFYAFKLLCASEQGKVRKTVRQWCHEYGLISGINAGMYQKDEIRHVGYMRNFKHINNGRFNNAYKAVLAFNPIDSSLPEIQIIDVECQDFPKVKNKYQTLIQNLRMINCKQENVWSQQEKMWGMAVLGMDKKGNALFIFTEFPYSGHDFINILLSLPLSIYNALYLEGGPEANLYFSTKGMEFERIGRLGGLMESSTVLAPRPIPNVIGIVEKLK
jgi:uncharacterized protein YigE (DUF2233 family)